MARQDTTSGTPGERLQEVLLGYLRDCPSWPGTDGITVTEILSSYALLAERGRVPDRAGLLRRHPELTAEVEKYFARQHGGQ